jgi:AcrR family transcriptional regulator
MAGTKKRARREAAGKGSKRDHVVDAATRLFLDEGYGTTGMDAIAKAADVSKATVYSYYDDKASLFADVMLRMCNEIGGHYVEASYEDSPEAVLRSVARFLIARMFETLDRRLLQRVVAEAKEFPELGKKFWATGPGKLEDSVAAYLADADRRGVLAVADPRRAAARFVGLVSGVYLLPLQLGVRTRPSEQEMRRDIDEVITGFLATLRPGR